MKKSLAKNAAYKAILNLFNLLVPLLVGPYIARILSVEYLGMYNRVYSEFQIFFTLAAFGIYNYGLREVSRIRNDKEKLNSLFTNLFLISTVANVFIGGVYILYFLNRATGYDEIIYGTMLIQLVANIFYIEFINEAIENYSFITIKTILIRIGYLVAMFLFVRTATDVLMYALIINVTVLLNNVASFVYLKKQIHFDFSNITLLKHLMPLLVALILTNVEILYAQFDRLMLGWFYSPIQSVSDVAVSNYFIPYNLVGMIATVPLSLVSVAIPRLSLYIGEKDKHSYEDTLNNTTRVFMAMIIPISFGIIAIAEEVMWVYAGDQYVNASIVLIVAALCRFAFAYQTIFSNLIMYVNGMEKQLVLFLAIFGFCNVGLNFGLYCIDYFEPATLLATTGISVLLFDISVNKYIKQRLDIEFKMFTKPIFGYFMIGVLFIPISYVVHLFDLGYITNMMIIMPICALLYIGYLYYKKDTVLSVLLSKFKVKALINKLRRKV